jgi:glycosyltransferase involved in cell wall biosynthesis
MKLNWFSPLPPERTDIAHYTGRVASALMRNFEVVFWTDQRAGAHTLPAGSDVCFFDREHIEGRSFNAQLFSGLNVYNFGNDARFHSGIFRVARKIPGLAVLHDSRLHHFVFEMHRGDDPPWAGYLNLAREYYGEVGRAKAEAIVAADGRTVIDAIEDMPFVEAVTDNAIAVLSHSSLGLRQRSSAPVLTLPLPFESLPPNSNIKRAWRPPWRFVLFGYVNTNRRLESVIRALGTVRDTYDFQFDIYGTLWDEFAVRSLIAQCGLTGRINIHGFVPETELDRAIASAHVAFHLRHPTMGEASGGILRSWAHATPTLVTDADWFAGLPNNIVLKLSVENEIADIQKVFAQLHEDSSRFETIGLAARSWLQQMHSPDHYAQALSAALLDLPMLMTRYAGRRMLLHLAAVAPCRNERRILLERAVEAIPTLFA